MNLCQYHCCRKPIPIEGRSDRTFCSKRCKGLAGVGRRRLKLKQRAFEYCGSKCYDCNYSESKYLEVYEFHHLDPSQKDFAISHDGLVRGWEKVRDELDKCVMLCCRCHRIRHAIETEQRKIGTP